MRAWSSLFTPHQDTNYRNTIHHSLQTHLLKLSKIFNQFTFSEFCFAKGLGSSYGSKQKEGSGFEGIFQQQTVFEKNFAVCSLSFCVFCFCLVLFWLFHTPSFLQCLLLHVPFLHVHSHHWEKIHVPHL